MRSRALLTLFALVVAAVAVTTLTPGQRRAEAAPTTRDRVASASGDATAGIAIVATSSGHSILARGLVIHSGTAGLLELRDGSSAGTVLARLYVPQNSTLQVGPDVLGPLGVQTTRGNSLFAVLAGTIATTTRYNESTASGAGGPGGGPTAADRVATASGDATSGIAVLAASSGRSLVVRGLALHSGTAGVVVFRDGAADGTVLGRFYVAANTPLLVGEDLLGGGMRTSRGNALYAVHAATTNFTLRFNEE